MFAKFLDPKNDVAFKKIFGNEKNKDILIHFLNDVLVFKGKNPIRSVIFLPTVQDPDTVSQKTSIVDILCKDILGSQYIIEMQVANSKGFEKRAQYYASKAYIAQAKKGGKYHQLKEVIFLAIADFVMFPKKAKYQSNHVILDDESYERDLKDFSFTFIELPKFHKTLDELSSIREKWCYFFKHAEETSPEDLKKIIGKDVILEKAYHALDSAYWSKEELLAYEQAEKRIKDYMAGLEQKFDEGKTQGRAEERAKAELEKAELQAKAELEKAELQAKAELEKAELQAKAELEKAELQAKAKLEKAELQERLAKFAKKMLEKGYSLEEISIDTGLSIEEITGLL